MARQRILHVMDKLSVDGSQIQGPARQVAYRAAHYDRRRWEVKVCNLRSEAAAADLLRESGVSVVSLNRGKFSPWALTDLIRLIRAWRPGVLHLSGYAAWTFGRLAGLITGVPVVVQEHFVDQRVPGYQRFVDWLLGGLQVRGIAVAESVKEFMLHDRALRGTEIDVIGNGVPVGQPLHADSEEVVALRRSLNIASEAKVVGIVGRLAEMKGHTYFLRAAKLIARRLPETVFVLVGEGSLRAALTEEAAQLGIAERIRFVGHQANVQLYLSLFDVNVIASIYGEGFPSVGLESFAAEVPVVSTDLETFRGIYEDRRNVLMVPARNSEAMAEAIERILTQPELVRALIQGGREMVKRFDVEAAARLYVECYERVIRRERGKSTQPLAGRPGVCVLTSTFHPIVGGGETYARNIGSRLAERGLPVSVITQRLLPDLKKRETVDGIVVHRVPPLGFPRFGKYLMIPWAMLKLVQLRGTYDVIYVSNFRVLGPVGLLMARLLGKRCVLRAGICGEFSGQYVSENGVLPAAVVSCLGAALRLRTAILRRADGFVSNCEAVSEEFRMGGVASEKVALLPGGVDTHRFQPNGSADRGIMRRQLGLPADRFLLGYSGKLNRGKGLNYLVASLPGILRRFPDSHLVLVGSGRNQFLSQEDELREIVRTLGVQDHVTFTGYVENVSDYLQSLDCYVLPTEYEALPNALLEAMACGLPCIATRVGGVPDIISDGENGRLVAPADPQALERAVIEVREQPEQTVRWRLEARSSIEARYSLEVLALRHQEFLTVLCNGKPKPDAGVAVPEDMQ